MKTNLIKKTLFLLSIFALTCTSSMFAQSTEITSDVRAEIEKLNQSIEKSMSKKSLSDIAAMYVDDATILTPGGKKVHGRKEIADYWYNMANCRDFKSEITELGGNGKMVYQIGKWTMTMEKDGKLTTYSTDVVLVWKRESSYDYRIQLQSINNTMTLSEINAPANSAEIK
jgi:ketosteroid isomerase-like protein